MKRWVLGMVLAGCGARQEGQTEPPATAWVASASNDAACPPPEHAACGLGDGKAECRQGLVCHSERGTTLASVPCPGTPGGVCKIFNTR